MNFCPITLKPIPDEASFSRVGLRAFHPRLMNLAPLDLSHEEQLRQARLRADKMSIQGVQPKLSALLRLKKGTFEIVDRGGKFLMKPNPLPYFEVPANEALTMRMAASAGIEVPPNGLIPATDGSWIFVIRRFDREGRNRRLHVEDFAQLSGATRETKYESSLERVAGIVEQILYLPGNREAQAGEAPPFLFSDRQRRHASEELFSDRSQKGRHPFACLRSSQHDIGFGKCEGRIGASTIRQKEKIDSGTMDRGLFAGASQTTKKAN